MKYFLLAAFMLCNINQAAHAQGAKSPPPNAIVIDETRTVEVPAKPSRTKKAKAPRASSTTKKVTTGKNGFTTTTTTTQAVAPAPTPVSNYPASNYSTPVVTAPYPTPSQAVPPNSSAPGTAAAPTGTSTAAATPAAPTAPPSPWSAVYFAEYFGPRLSNIDFEKAQGPDDADPSYTMVDHSVKVLYAVSKSNKLGVQIRGRSPFNPTKSFFFKNFRLVSTWKNMVDTPDLNMGVVFDIELPTRGSDREKGKLLDLNLKLNWELKTQLRNWSFSAMTLIRPSFYNDPTTQSDLYFGIFPWVTMDLAPDWQLIFEASFDASHAYQAIAFDFGSDDPDYIRTGVGYSFSPHFQINPAIQFYTSAISFKAAVLYMSLTASL